MRQKSNVKLRGRPLLACPSRMTGWAWQHNATKYIWATDRYTVFWLGKRFAGMQIFLIRRAFLLAYQWGAE